MPISKVNEVTLEALHVVERGNMSFAAASIRLGGRRLQALVSEYAELPKLVPHA